MESEKIDAAWRGEMDAHCKEIGSLFNKVADLEAKVQILLLAAYTHNSYIMDKEEIDGL